MVYFITQKIAAFYIILESQKISSHMRADKYSTAKANKCLPSVFDKESIYCTCVCVRHGVRG